MPSNVANVVSFIQQLLSKQPTLTLEVRETGRIIGRAAQPLLEEWRALYALLARKKLRLPVERLTLDWVRNDLNASFFRLLAPPEPVPVALVASHSVALDAALEFVRAHPLCPMSELAAEILQRFGNASWIGLVQHSIVFDTADVDVSAPQPVIWRDSKDDRLALAKSDLRPAVAAAAPSPPPPPKTLKILKRKSNWRVVKSLAALGDAMALILAADAVGVDLVGAKPARLVNVALSADVVFVLDMKFADSHLVHAAMGDALRTLLAASDVVKVFCDARRSLPLLCADLLCGSKDVASVFDVQVGVEALFQLNLATRAADSASHAPLHGALDALMVPHKEPSAVEFSLDEQDFPSDVLAFLTWPAQLLPRARTAILERLHSGVVAWSHRHVDWSGSAPPPPVAAPAFVMPPLDVLCALRFSGAVLSPTAIDSLNSAARAAAEQVGVRFDPSDASQREFQLLLQLLPARVRAVLAAPERQPYYHELAEVLIDVAAPVVLVMRSGRRECLADCVLSERDLEDISDEWSISGLAIGLDNRLQAPGTLHVVSVKRERSSLSIVALTARLVFHLPIAELLLRDVVASIVHQCKSVLVLGARKTGRTALLRDIARLAALERTVEVIDTTNQIAGESPQKHASIGLARRTSVPVSRSAGVDQQAVVLNETLANVAPDVLVIDMIDTREQLRIAATAVAAGVSVVASVSDVRANSDVNTLFHTVVELTRFGELVVYSDAKATLEATVERPVLVTRRWCDVHGGVWTRCENFPHKPVEVDKRQSTGAASPGWFTKLLVQ
jgi:stage III sporulation protein SpoIIIAA